MSAKNPVATPDLRGGTIQPGRRGDAVGAEIPVTVHASRSAQGLGKNLPPVHEETRTVVVLPQGAVVRLTATLTPGETVVLTNRVTGADVLCRVGNVKSQPGIQHYVDLEFIKCAPGFWGQSTPTVPSSRATEMPATVSMPVATWAPTQFAPPPRPVAVVRRLPQTAPSPPFMQGSAPVPESPALLAPSPVVPLDVHTQPSDELLRPAPLAESVRDSMTEARLAIGAAAALSMDSALGSVGGGLAPRYSTASSKVWMTAAAAVLLVLGGGFGGYWLTRHGNSVANLAPQPAAKVAPSQPASVASALATVGPEPVSLNASVTSPQPQADILDSRPTVGASPPRIVPQVSPRAIVPAVRHSKVTVEAIKAPILKSASPRGNAAEPAPIVIATSNALGDSVTASGLIDSLAGTSTPPPPRAASCNLHSSCRPRRPCIQLWPGHRVCKEWLYWMSGSMKLVKLSQRI